MKNITKYAVLGMLLLGATNRAFGAEEQKTLSLIIKNNTGKELTFKAQGAAEAETVKPENISNATEDEDIAIPLNFTQLVYPLQKGNPFSKNILKFDNKEFVVIFEATLLKDLTEILTAFIVEKKDEHNYSKKQSFQLKIKDADKIKDFKALLVFNGTPQDSFILIRPKTYSTLDQQTIDAIKNKNAKSLEDALAQGANPNLIAGSWNPILIAAIHKEDIALVKAILKYRPDKWQKGRNGLRPFEYAQKLLDKAAKKGKDSEDYRNMLAIRQLLYN
ncbi:MAG: hypothetical protein AB7R69_02760 [Candidatus Babeliales bacterium]